MGTNNKRGWARQKKPQKRSSLGFRRRVGAERRILSVGMSLALKSPLNRHPEIQNRYLHAKESGVRVAGLPQLD
jgi:hypothetical protein